MNQDIDPNDPIEQLGRRIGRALGFVALAGLLVWIAVAYL